MRRRGRARAMEGGMRMERSTDTAGVVVDVGIGGRDATSW